MSLDNYFIPIVLCAGFGTRLMPLTKMFPKVICPIINKPIAFMNIEIFFKKGFKRVYCNTHYLSKTVQNELQTCLENFGYDPQRVVFFNETELLGTGGGIANIFHKLVEEDYNNCKKDVIVVSGDIVGNFDFDIMIQRWSTRQKNETSLMMSHALDEMRPDIMWVSDDLQYVVNFGYNDTNESVVTKKIARLFSNHQIISHELLQELPTIHGSSITLFYKKALASKQKIIHIPYCDKLYWFNVGSIDEYQKCISFLMENEKTKKNTAVLENNINFFHYLPTWMQQQIPTTLIGQTSRFTNTAPNFSDNIYLSFLNFQRSASRVIPMEALFSSDRTSTHNNSGFYFVL